MCPLRQPWKWTHSWMTCVREFLAGSFKMYCKDNIHINVWHAIHLDSMTKQCSNRSTSTDTTGISVFILNTYKKLVRTETKTKLIQDLQYAVGCGETPPDRTVNRPKKAFPDIFQAITKALPMEFTCWSQLFPVGFCCSVPFLSYYYNCR